MSISEYSGGSALAFKGQECVVVAADRKLGAQFQMISQTFRKVFKMNDHILLILTGLGTDVLTFSQQMAYRVKIYQLRENKQMSVKTFIHLVSSSLYEKRFGPFILSTMVAGLQKEGGKWTPQVAHYDSIGNVSSTEQFQVSGTAEDQLYGACETYFKADCVSDELKQRAAQCFMSATDRDIYSGWGGCVYTMTPEKIVVEVLKSDIV